MISSSRAPAPGDSCAPVRMADTDFAPYAVQREVRGGQAARLEFVVS